MHLKIAFLVCVTFLLAGCRTPVAQSPTPYIVVTCTLEGCGTALSIILSGPVPRDYVLEAVTPYDEKMSVHCIDGSGQYADNHFQRNSYPLCTQEGVEFIRFSPDEVTITISWNGKTASQSFEPVYEIHYPNGPNCEPACRVGQVTFTIADN